MSEQNPLKVRPTSGGRQTVSLTTRGASPSAEKDPEDSLADVEETSLTLQKVEESSLIPDWSEVSDKQETSHLSVAGNLQPVPIQGPLISSSPMLSLLPSMFDLSILETKVPELLAMLAVADRPEIESERRVASERAMIEQALEWVGSVEVAKEQQSSSREIKGYSDSLLFSLYELGRVYCQMGYLAPSERIFQGLAFCDRGKTPARIGLGLIKLETGLFEAAAASFRGAIDYDQLPLRARLGMSFVFLAQRDFARASSLLILVEKEFSSELAKNSVLKRLFEAAKLRASKNSSSENQASLSSVTERVEQ